MCEDTIDWDAYWDDVREEGEEPQEYTANVSRYHLELLERFIEKTGVPDDAAFIGCGPGDLAAAIAESYPDSEVIGYDAAESIIRANQADYEKYAGLSNLSFEVAALPEFNVHRQFDLVFCYATLHYVRETESAVRVLYHHVRPGGYLICHYPNQDYRKNHQDIDGELRDRLQLVYEGENLLSRESIADLLETAVNDFWEFVEADGPQVHPGNPCIFVEK